MNNNSDNNTNQDNYGDNSHNNHIINIIDNFRNIIELINNQSDYHESNIMIDHPEINNQANQVDYNEDSNQLPNDHNEPNVQINHSEPNVQINHNEPNVQIDHNELNIQIDHNELNIQIDHNEPNIQIDHNEPNVQVNHNEDSNQLPNTQSQPINIRDLVNEMINSNQYPDYLSYMSNSNQYPGDSSYMRGYNHEMYEHIENTVVPYLYQWDDTPDDFYQHMINRLYDDGFHDSVMVYNNIGVYLYLNSQEGTNIENQMNYIRRYLATQIILQRNRNNSFARQMIGALLGQNIIIPNDMQYYDQIIILNGEINPMQSLEPVKLTISKDELDKNPIIEYNKLDDEIKKINDACSICQTDFIPTAEVRHLKWCKHVFHPECCDRWLLQESHKCPTCRTEAPTHVANT